MGSSKLRLYGSTSGFVELEAPAVAPDAALVLPSTFAGIGSNVVQTVKTDTASASSTSFIDIDGLSATITPSSDTSKILVIANLNGSAREEVYFRLNGGGSDAYVGDADGSRASVATGIFRRDGGSWDFRRSSVEFSMVYLASPGVTSPVTFSVQWRVNSSTAHLNRSHLDEDADTRARSASSLTLVEVAA